MLEYSLDHENRPFINSVDRLDLPKTHYKLHHGP